MRSWCRHIRKRIALFLLKESGKFILTVGIMMHAHVGYNMGKTHTIAFRVSFHLFFFTVRHSRAPLAKKVMWAHTFYVLIPPRCPAATDRVYEKKDYFITRLHWRLLLLFWNHTLTITGRLKQPIV